MFLAASLFFVGSAQSAPPAPYNSFLEKIIASEVGLRLDRRDARDTKNGKSAIQVLMKDAAQARAVIQSFQDSTLSSLADNAPKALIAFRDELEKFKATLEPVQLLGRVKAATQEGSSCCDHDAAYLKLITAAVRAPGFNMHILSSPARYNLSPVLYDKPAGLVYADASAADRALILPRIVQKNSKLRRGDVIVAVRGDDEEEWETVKTWGDVLRASNDFETGEAQVFIRVRRGQGTKDLVLASSTVIVNTE